MQLWKESWWQAGSKNLNWSGQPIKNCYLAVLLHRGHWAGFIWIKDPTYLLPLAEDGFPTDAGFRRLKRLEHQAKSLQWGEGPIRVIVDPASYKAYAGFARYACPHVRMIMPGDSLPGIYWAKAGGTWTMIGDKW